MNSQTACTVNIELINTGSELMLGFVLNSHQAWLCRQLADLGYPVTRQSAVHDSGAAIQQIVGEALSRADLVIVTGGLGPTSDDLTRDVVAALVRRPLHEDPAVLACIERFFAARNRPMPARAGIQALVPEGAIVLPNAHGTAPGLVLDLDPNPCRQDGKAALLVMLPGPPRELRPMFSEQVVPMLQRRFPLQAPFACRVLKTTGLPESLLEDKIAGPLASLVAVGLVIGYCARIGEVEVRLAAQGPNAAQIVEEAEQIVRSIVGRNIFGMNQDELAGVLVRLLTERGQTVALAESCTGGYIAHRLTNVAGASAVFLSGLVTYSNQAKQRLLGVKTETLAAHGAVSEPTAREMAEGARSRVGADFALAVTGIAGPTGGTPGKPVGTVYIALASGQETIVERYLNPYDRETFKRVTSQQALELLRQNLLMQKDTSAP
ncbi:MAG: competence/damage-inducible protein A [Verrucomicrobiota bacterium]